MTIAKADILTEVNNRLGLGLTDIDTELQAIMTEVSALTPGILQKTGSVTVLINTTNIALPTDIINDVAVVDSDGVPLTKKSFQLVISKLRASTSAATPKIYAFFDRKIYVYPKALAATVLTLYYDHDDTSVGSIGLPDEAAEALIEGVCYKVELGKGVLGELSPGTISHYTFYQDQIKVLQARYQIYRE